MSIQMQLYLFTALEAVVLLQGMPEETRRSLFFSWRHGLISFSHAELRRTPSRKLLAPPAGRGAETPVGEAGASDRSVGENHRRVATRRQAASRPVLEGRTEERPPEAGPKARRKVRPAREPADP